MLALRRPDFSNRSKPGAGQRRSLDIRSKNLGPRSLEAVLEVQLRELRIELVAPDVIDRDAPVVGHLVRHRDLEGALIPTERVHDAAPANAVSVIG